jgi:hypothetical protein
MANGSPLIRREQQQRFGGSTTFNIFDSKSVVVALLTKSEPVA